MQELKIITSDNYIKKQNMVSFFGYSQNARQILFKFLADRKLLVIFNSEMLRKNRGAFSEKTSRSLTWPRGTKRRRSAKPVIKRNIHLQ